MTTTDPTPEHEPGTLTIKQLDAIRDMGRTVTESITRMWEAVRPALVKIGEAMARVHEDACLPGDKGLCIVCHEPAHLRPPAREDGEDDDTPTHRVDTHPQA